MPPTDAHSSPAPPTHGGYTVTICPFDRSQPEAVGLDRRNPGQLLVRPAAVCLGGDCMAWEPADSTDEDESRSDVEQRGRCLLIPRSPTIAMRVPPIRYWSGR